MKSRAAKERTAVRKELIKQAESTKLFLCLLQRRRIPRNLEKTLALGPLDLPEDKLRFSASILRTQSPFSYCVMQTTAHAPKRIVLRLYTKFELQEHAILQAFFTFYQLSNDKLDYYCHLCAPNLSSKMHIILDLLCQKYPIVDLQIVEHQVFRVDRNDEGDL